MTCSDCSLLSSDTCRSFVYLELLGDDEAEAVDECDEAKDSSNVRETGEWLTSLLFVGKTDSSPLNSQLEATVLGKFAASSFTLLLCSLNSVLEALLNGIEGSIEMSANEIHHFLKHAKLTLSPKLTI